jgi:hypothetical protein
MLLQGYCEGYAICINIFNRCVVLVANPLGDEDNTAIAWF